MKLYVKKKYGVVPNELLNNPAISLRAKGLFAYLQSKPSEWRFSIKRISQQTREGKDAIRNALKELEKSGYLQRIPARNERGKWSGYDYVLAEKPLTENPTTEKPSTENPDTLSKKDSSKKEVVKKIKNIDRRSRKPKTKNQLLKEKIRYNEKEGRFENFPEELISYFQEKYPGIDVKNVIKTMEAWIFTKFILKGKHSPYKDYAAALARWLAKEAKEQKQQQKGGIIDVVTRGVSRYVGITKSEERNKKFKDEFIP